MDARAAWDWLTASGDVPEVTLRDLEYFLWYQLPAKFLVDHDEHRAVALALGGLLDDLGCADGRQRASDRTGRISSSTASRLPKVAAVCRKVAIDVLAEAAAREGPQSG